MSPTNIENKSSKKVKIIKKKRSGKQIYRYMFKACSRLRYRISETFVFLSNLV